MICPNKSSKEWKILVEKHGQDRAEEMFIENGFEIPVEEIEEPIFKTDYMGNEVISGIHTRMLSHEAPKVFEQILNRLKELYPGIRIFKDGLFDKDGNWIQIKPGEKGMHYRNAFVSAVAWANDSYLETPPHEYAHDYIDMFRDHPLVQEGIKKYGEERLVTIMGRYFANQEISKQSENYIKKFWNFVKSIFGNNDVAYILSKKFYEGQALSANKYAGSGVVSYQKTQIEKYKNQKGLLDLGDDYIPKTKNTISLDQAKGRLLSRLSNRGIKEELIFLGEDKSSIYDVNLAVRSLLTDLELFFQKDAFSKTKGLDEKTLGIMKLQLGDQGFSNEQILMLLEAIKEDKPINDKKVQQFYNRLLMIEQAQDFLPYKDKIMLGDNKYVDVEPLQDDIVNEIDEHVEVRDKRFAKIKNPFLGEMVKGLEKISRFQMNTRLIAKTLTGSEDSKLYNLFYKSLNWAERTRQSLLLEFDDLMKGNWQKEKNGSIYLKGGKSIDDVESKTFSFLDKNKKNRVDVKLTIAEALNLYMVLRQNELGPSEELSPREILMNEGFVLDKTLNRELTDATVFKLDENIEAEIKDYIEQNHAEFIAKVDEAMNFMYDKVNETHKQENGFDLGKVKNYFPVYHKIQSASKGGAKSVISEVRQLHMRLGGGTIKISDVHQVINQYKSSSAIYTSYAIPLDNNKKIANKLLDRYKGTNVEKFVEQWNRDLLRIDDNLVIYPTNAESKIDSWINKVTNNFSVAVLGMNAAVSFKQTVSYLAATNYIDSKYLRKAGFGIGNIVTINPKSFIDFMTITGVEKTDNIMDLLPVKLKMKENDPIYQEIIKSSPKLSYRFKGVVSREAGEILMDPALSDVITIKIPGTNKTIRTTKSRLMLWITMMDAATIKDIWKAVRFEAIDNGLKEGRPEFLEYVSNRAEEIIDFTQPTFDMVNRAELSKINSPLLRTFTMFSSATSKLGMIVIDKYIDYINNPNPKTKKALITGLVSTMVYTSAAVAFIDLLKAGLIYGFDDDDDESKVVGAFNRNLVLNAFSPFYGVSTASRMIYTRLDGERWSATIQHPLEGIINNGADAISDLGSGNIDKGSMKALNLLFQAKGLPADIINMPMKMVQESIDKK